MRLAGRMLLDLHHRLKGSHSLTMLREIESRSRLSREEILAYQFSQLSALLAEAEAHVPYYREMFQKLGIRSQDIRSLEDFSALPILTKDIIRERAQDLVREDLAKDKLRVSHSGGSTGVPLSFYHDSSYDDASEAGTFRNLTQCGWRPGDVIAYIWGGNDRLYAMPRWKVEFHQYLLGKYTFDPFYSVEADQAFCHLRIRVDDRALRRAHSSSGPETTSAARRIQHRGKTLSAAAGGYLRRIWLPGL
jgi:phenylacetate-CoA ligase